MHMRSSPAPASHLTPRPPFETAKAGTSTSEDRYRQLIEHATEVFYEVGLDAGSFGGRMVYVSPQVLTLTGCPPEAFLEDPGLWMHLVHPADVDAVTATTTALATTGLTTTREYRIRHYTSGAYHRVEDCVVPRLDLQGRVVAYQGIARDIASRSWQQCQLETLVTLGGVLREGRSREAMIRDILGGLLALVNANGAAFATCDDEKEEIVFELGLGDLCEWTGRRVSASASVSATVIRSGIPWVTNTAREDPRLDQRDLPPGVQSYASLPLYADDHAIGALVMAKAQPFLDEEVQVLRTVCEMAATALRRQLLHEQLLHSTAVLEETYDRTIEGWARALDMRDRATEGHARRVTDMTLRLAKWIGVPREQLPHLRRGAMLHDIGKMAVPDHILQKPGPLTDEERRVMRQHVAHAHAMLGPIEFLRPALDIPQFHHERWDGSGYPEGLSGENIPLAARIFAVADVYDAISSDRPYAPAESRKAARDFIVAQSGIKFDPGVVEALLAVEADVLR